MKKLAHTEKAACQERVQIDESMSAFAPNSLTFKRCWWWMLSSREHSTFKQTNNIFHTVAVWARCSHNGL